MSITMVEKAEKQVQRLMREREVGLMMKQRVSCSRHKAGMEAIMEPSAAGYRSTQQRPPS